jgi:hypothetical protein
VVAGGALCGLAGAYMSTVYTPLWVEGMIAGKGWIALALTTFATWRPARVLLGAYLFGGVTMLQFHLQGIGRGRAQPVPDHDALPGHHRGAGADLAQPDLDPREHARLDRETLLPGFIIFYCPFFSTPNPPRGFHDRPEQTFPDQAGGPDGRGQRRPDRLRQEGRGGRAGGRPRTGPGGRCRPKPEPLKIAFAYVGPVGDGGWTFAHDNGRKALEAEFGDKVKTSFVENVPESADAERVIRDLASQGNKLIFGTTFGYMEPMLKVAADFKDVKFEHATGYKTAENMRTYDSRTYEGAYMAGVIAGKP